MLQKIIECLGASSGQNFLNKISLNMCEILELDYVFIARFDNKLKSAKTISVAAQSNIVENFEYELEHTPCEGVSKDCVSCYPENIQNLFPKDELLIEMNIESYLGSPLHNTQGEIIGLIVAMGIKPINNEDNIKNLFAMFSGRISAEMINIEQEKQIEYMVYHNNLTKLYNIAYLEKEIAKNPIRSIIILDINNFSYINSSYDFFVGDAVLCEIAKTLPLITKDATCFHGGSDEFILLFDDNDTDIKNTILSIKHYFHTNPLLINEIGINVSFNYGGAAGLSDVLMDAMLALKISKNNGANSYHIYDTKKDSVSTEERLAFTHYSKLLRKSLSNGGVIPFFQGLHNNATKKITKYEALVRIKDGDKIMSPYLFLEAAKLSGILPEITKTMIDQVFSIMTSSACDFSINITEDDLRDDYLASYIETSAKKYKICLSRVILEILEDVSPHSKTSNSEQLSTIKKLGCKLAIDDFGAEYSNFERLINLDIDFIKIDAKYIKNIHTDIKCYNIVSAIVFFAKKSNIECVAEHVDCKEVQDIVENLGIEYSQGFYFSKPELFSPNM